MLRGGSGGPGGGSGGPGGGSGGPGRFETLISYEGFSSKGSGGVLNKRVLLKTSIGHIGIARALRSS